MYGALPLAKMHQNHQSSIHREDHRGTSSTSSLPLTRYSREERRATRGRGRKELPLLNTLTDLRNVGTSLPLVLRKGT
jgi:hypothetical protein